MLCICFYVFESVQAKFYPGHFWLTGRQIHSSLSYVFLCFHVSMFAYMNRVTHYLSYWTFCGVLPIGRLTANW